MHLENVRTQTMKKMIKSPPRCKEYFDKMVDACFKQYVEILS